jgi:hypothetical protein
MHRISRLKSTSIILCEILEICTATIALDALRERDLLFLLVGRASPLSRKPDVCELVHIGLTGFRCSIHPVAEGPMPMAEQPAKRIPNWLTIDVLVILGSLAIIVVGIWMGL